MAGFIFGVCYLRIGTVFLHSLVLYGLYLFLSSLMGILLSFRSRI